MKVQTANGLVELTAEMVRPGMVFRNRKGEILTTCTRRAWNIWTDAADSRFSGSVLWWAELLGCDPTIATREDCALYGIAPGIDAGAHGFARLRDGGAVDVYRSPLPMGAVLIGDDDYRRTETPSMRLACWPPDQFVGLDGRYARPEDVRRLCCGAEHPGDAVVFGAQCTLAIGDHDEHEDIATGVKWKVGEIGQRSPKTPECDSCGCQRRCPWFTSAGTDPDGVACETCGCMFCGPQRCDSHMPGTNDLARCALAKHKDGKHRDVLGREWGEAPTMPSVWTRLANGDEWSTAGSLFCAIHHRDGGWECEVGSDSYRSVFGWCKTREHAKVLASALAARIAGSAVCEDAAEAVCGGLLSHWDHARAFCDFFAGLKTWSASPAGQVVLRDTAVAKAIADVPAGCSASGWANVVRVIAADVQEYRTTTPESRTWRRDAFDFGMRSIRDPLAVYARARFVDGYDVDTARRRGWREANKAAVENDFAARLFAAYEAGR